MRAVPRTAPTIIPVDLPKGLFSGDGGDEEVARGRLADEEIVAEDEELAVLEDFVAEDASTVLVTVDGLDDTISPFSKNTPFL